MAALGNNTRGFITDHVVEVSMCLIGVDAVHRNRVVSSKSLPLWAGVKTMLVRRDSAQGVDNNCLPMSA